MSSRPAAESVMEASWRTRSAIIRAALWPNSIALVMLPTSTRRAAIFALPSSISTACAASVPTPAPKSPPVRRRPDAPRRRPGPPEPSEGPGTPALAAEPRNRNRNVIGSDRFDQLDFRLPAGLPLPPGFRRGPRNDALIHTIRLSSRSVPAFAGKRGPEQSRPAPHGEASTTPEGRPQ